ncbi:pyrimidine 5'-nucleotidase [Ferrovibrio sp.]|uniref:pyrimidine 5'-nucleotidase n=1 Tax=Ferrovibrio sp. TaxID=1917215 RepID=UPI0025C0F6BB|nr:pyrimidine 5'-nucleotidase [Ferrovibrio sp.]MBX3455406.1 pyrimidine 5'-nucleotidase [Ferrovibrio sp.]
MIREPTALRSAETWLFDLDNTLYPAKYDLFAQIDRRMGEFIAQQFDLSYDQAKLRQKSFFHSHGTTLRGLMVEYGLDPADFLNYVHDIDLTPLPALPDLRNALEALPGRKLVFTNGTVAHAERVMRHIGIADCFEAVFDIVASGYLPKPHPQPYGKLLAEHGVVPQSCVMVEDMARNLAPAAALGMSTVWVPTKADWSAPRPGEEDHIHHVAPDLTAFLQQVTGG